MKWQPWKTAPKDGSKIIALYEDGSGVIGLFYGEREIDGAEGFVTFDHIFDEDCTYAGWIPCPVLPKKQQSSIIEPDTVPVSVLFQDEKPNANIRRLRVMFEDDGIKTLGDITSRSVSYFIARHENVGEKKIRLLSKEMQKHGVRWGYVD